MPRPCHGRSKRDSLLFTISCAALSDMVLTTGAPKPPPRRRLMIPRSPHMSCLSQAAGNTACMSATRMPPFPPTPRPRAGLWLPDSFTGRSCPRVPAFSWWLSFFFPLPEVRPSPRRRRLVPALRGPPAASALLRSQFLDAIVLLALWVLLIGMMVRAALAAPPRPRPPKSRPQGGLQMQSPPPHTHTPSSKLTTLERAADLGHDANIVPPREGRRAHQIRACLHSHRRLLRRRLPLRRESQPGAHAVPAPRPPAAFCAAKRQPCATHAARCCSIALANRPGSTSTRS